MRVQRITEKNFEHLHIYEGYEDNSNEAFVAFEIEFEKDNVVSLEHVWRVPKFKGIKALPQVIDWLANEFKPKAIVCLPLQKYRGYYEELGFEQYEVNGEDIYYIKTFDNNKEDTNDVRS